MAPSWMQLLLVAVVALLIFGGRGRISSIMGDVAKGITSFRKGISEGGADDDKEIDKDDLVDVTPEKDKTKASS